MDYTGPQTLVKASFKVPTGFQFFCDPRIHHCLFVFRQFNSIQTIKLLLVFDFVEDSFGCEHACFHGRMAAFDLGYVEETGGTSCEHTTWEGQFRDGVVATFIEHTCPV